jgi:hypothetical protein
MMARDDLEIPGEQLADVTGGFVPTGLAWLARRAAARRDIARWWDAIERERAAKT